MVTILLLILVLLFSIFNSVYMHYRPFWNCKSVCLLLLKTLKPISRSIRLKFRKSIILQKNNLLTSIKNLLIVYYYLTFKIIHFGLFIFYNFVYSFHSSFCCCCLFYYLYIFSFFLLFFPSHLNNNNNFNKHSFADWVFWPRGVPNASLRCIHSPTNANDSLRWNRHRHKMRKSLHNWKQKC